MPEVLIQSKITAPQLNSKIVHRERLTSLLDENINKNLIIICAPAGFGKTTLVLDFLNRGSIRHAWFSIPHKGIADASTFFEYLLNAFANIEKDFGSDTLEVMKQFTQSPQLAKELVSGCTASFVNEFQRYFKDNITLVIDDLHFIDSEKSLKWLKEFFDELYENIPPNLHLLIVTRVMPELNMTKLKAKRNIFIITEKELTFDKDETGELLDSVYKYSYSKEDLNLLEDNLKGWITGIHLLLQAYGEDYKNVKYSGDIGYSSIFVFFAQEIFDNLCSELQEFLLVTSLIDNFDESISNAVLEIKNSRSLLEELIKKNLFIQQSYSTGNDGCIKYNYHALFRNFLNERIKKSRIAEDIKKIMEKIGDSYLQSSDEVTAINYFLEAENYEKAVPIIEEILQKLFYSGKDDIILKWYNLIPEDILNKNAILLFRKGCYNFWILKNYEKALEYSDKALEQFYQAGDEDNIATCWTVKALLLINTGKIKEAKDGLEELLNRNLKPKYAVAISYYLSRVYIELNQNKKAKELLEHAVALCKNFKLNKSIIYSSLGNLYSKEGSKEEGLEKSLFYYFKSLEDEEIIYNVTLTYCNIAITYCELKDYTSSIKYYDKTFQMLEKYYSIESFIFATSQKALLLQRLGDFKESTKLLENIYESLLKNNDCLSLWYVTYDLFENYYLLNDRGASLKYLKLNNSLTEKLNIEKFNKCFLIIEACFFLKYKSVKTDVNKLLDAYEYFDKLGIQYQRTEFLFYICKYYLINKNLKQASKYLVIFLNNSSFRVNDLIHSRDLFDFSLSRPELAQYKDKIHCAFTEFFDRLNIEGTSDEYKKKMKVQIENLYDLKMNSFGGLEFISRGNPVAESNWKKKKGKSILAYMMTDPKAKYSKDKLIEMFFPDAKPETTEDIFRQAVFNIRNAVKLPYLSILLHEGNKYFLNPDCYFKSDISEFNKYCRQIRANSRTKEEKIQACKDAVELYKGSFMEGVYETWCEEIREEYLNKFISVSETLLNMLDAEKEHEDIIFYSEKLISYDKLNELAYFKLIEAHVISGKQRIAREVYNKMLKVYQEELAEKPDGEIISKIEKVIGK